MGPKAPVNEPVADALDVRRAERPEPPGCCGAAPVVEVVGDVPLRNEPGVKLGASALSLVLDVGEGMETGSDAAWVDEVDEALSSLSLPLALTLRDPGFELVGEMALRSEIIRCRLLRASPPWVSTCFLVAAVTAASMAVTGGEVVVWSERTCCSAVGSIGIAIGTATAVEATAAGPGCCCCCCCCLSLLADDGRGGAAFTEDLRLMDCLLASPFVLVRCCCCFESPVPVTPAMMRAAALLPPSEVPPEMVVVLPLFFRLSLCPPDECELERDTDADESRDRWPRLLELLRLEAAELERSLAGGASVSAEGAAASDMAPGGVVFTMAYAMFCVKEGSSISWGRSGH